MRCCVNLPLIPSGILILLICFNCESGFTQPADFADEYGNPVLVLVEHNPWLMVLNSDEPTIVVYSNRRIIYQKTEEDRRVFYSVTLDSAEFNSLMSELHLENDSILKSPNSIELYEKGGATRDNLPTNELYIYTRDSLKFISIFGNLFTNNFYNRVPDVIVNIIKKLKEFSSPNANRWLPKKIEVLVWGYEYSPEIPLDWPESWPDTRSKDSYLHESSNSRDMYSIFLDSRYLDELKDLLANQQVKQAILMNGKEWAIRYRFPFPHQPKWWW